jgi:magnesium transporter
MELYIHGLSVYKIEGIMAKNIRKISKKMGLPPGSVVYVGKEQAEQVQIELLEYNSSGCLQEKKSVSVEELSAFGQNCLSRESAIRWINVIGVHNTEILERVGRQFGLHHLLLEDVANTHQRPKVQEFGKHVFVVLKMLRVDEKQVIHTEQTSFVLGKDFLLSFQERTGDVFESVRLRIRNQTGKICHLGADYLLYSLLDAIVDNYFMVLEKFGTDVEELEDRLFETEETKTVAVLHNIRREMILLRKQIWPVRELLNSLRKEEVGLIHEQTRIYMQDVYDHIIQILDLLEMQRDLVNSMVDTCFSRLSNRMNEIMKVLTIISTIFIPLTFITSIYGMNFENMPELKYIWAYPLVWLVILSIGMTMFVFFRRKKWL